MTQVPRLTENARGLLNILYQSEGFVPISNLRDELDVSSKGLGLVRSWMQSELSSDDIIEDSRSPDGNLSYRLNDEWRPRVGAILADEMESRTAERKKKSEKDDFSSQLTSAAEGLTAVLQPVLDSLSLAALRLDQFLKSEEGRRTAQGLLTIGEFVQQAEARLEEQERISSAIANFQQERLETDAEDRERLASVLERFEQYFDEIEKNSRPHGNDDPPRS